MKFSAVYLRCDVGFDSNASMNNQLRPIFLGFVCVFLTSCMSQDYTEVSGSTMGTYYRVHSKCPEPIQTAQIESLLAGMVQAFSTWDPNSTISEFNRAEANRWFSVDEEFLSVIDQADRMSRVSGGAFDLTVAPLVEAWGFGTTPEESIPSDEEIDSLLVQIGHEHLALRQDPPSIKKQQELQLDVAGIAKGYSVDQLAQLLDDQSCSDYLIDIGGEIKVKGLNPFSNPWQIAIESPKVDSEILDVFPLSNMSVASSGDYRNFRVIDGVKFSHIIDPRTGYPITHNLVAVTVLHSSCTTADAFATAMLVLGLEESVELAAEQELAAIFITRDNESDGFQLTMSKQMEPIIKSD